MGVSLLYVGLVLLVMQVFLLQQVEVHGQEILESNRPNVFGVDRLKAFYERVNEADVKYCDDRTRLLPSCKECIPGLQSSGKSGTSCDQYISSSDAIRAEILKITKERYKDDEGDQNRLPRPYGLYPYLEKGDFMTRQELFGSVLSKSKAKNIVDIGAYYNPIHLFLSSQSQGHKTDYCPESVLIIEPILDAMSVMIPCGNSSSFNNANQRMTHIVFIPVTFRYYMKHIIKKVELPQPDSVVCIGCDSHYGPNRHMLENTFSRPFDLFLEYPSQYVHNGPMRKMNGDGPGETMLFHRTLVPHTNETEYTKRSLKIIRYDVTNV